MRIIDNSGQTLSSVAINFNQFCIPFPEADRKYPYCMFGGHFVFYVPFRRKVVKGIRIRIQN